MGPEADTRLLHRPPVLNGPCWKNFHRLQTFRKCVIPFVGGVVFGNGWQGHFLTFRKREAVNLSLQVQLGVSLLRNSIYRPTGGPANLSVRDTHKCAF